MPDRERERASERAQVSETEIEGHRQTEGERDRGTRASEKDGMRRQTQPHTYMHTIHRSIGMLSLTHSLFHPSVYRMYIPGRHQE